MRLLCPMIVLLASTVLAGCAPEVAPLAAAPSGNEAPYAEPRLMTDAAAREIVASGDAARIRAASAQLVAQARWFTSPVWHDAYRAHLVVTERTAGRSPSPAEIERETSNQRNALVALALGAMEIIGGPDAVAYCLWLGENESAPLMLRRAALRVLVRHADRNDPTVRVRAQAIWEKMAALPAHGPVGSVNVGSSTLTGSVTNASEVVGGAQKGFRRCYNMGLREDANMQGTIRVTARIDASGAVASVTETHIGVSEAVAACVAARVRTALFAPPQGGGATVVIPVTFTSR